MNAAEQKPLKVGDRVRLRNATGGYMPGSVGTVVRVMHNGAYVDMGKYGLERDTIPVATEELELGGNT